MNDFQYWTMFASVMTLIATGLGWVVAWVKGLSNRISKLEIDLAVQKAIIEERKHDH